MAEFKPADISPLELTTRGKTALLVGPCGLPSQVVSVLDRCVAMGSVLPTGDPVGSMWSRGFCMNDSLWPTTCGRTSQP